MSKTFTPPPEDCLFLPHWIQHHARHSPEHPVFVYGDAHTEPKLVTWSNAAYAFGRAARIINSIKAPEQREEVPQVFGILANLDSLTYFTLAVGILTAGCTAFLISTRNSPAAVSHLLMKTRTQKIFVSSDELMQKLAFAALATLDDGHSVELLPVPTIQDFFSGNPSDEHLVSPNFRADSPAVMIHSSGSTAFPKVVTMSHRMIAEIGRSPVICGADLSQVRYSLHGLPVFHAMAFNMFSWTARNGATMAFFPPQVPPVIPSPRNILDAAVTTKCTILYSVPHFIELWSHNLDDVKKMKTFDVVAFAGGPLNKHIGDELSRVGISLSALYGGSEIGSGSMTMANEITPEWDWLTARPDIETIFLPQEDAPDLFEIVFVEGPLFVPAVLNSVIDGKRAFATNDLAIRHPTNPTKFKIYGRKDDQIMLSTGEKTNPGPIEAIICKHPFVQDCVMFGRGRAQNGIIVRPAKGHEIIPTDVDLLAKFRNNIWTSVQEANAFAPSHSRIYKEMIIVAHPSKPFDMTAKLTPRRSVVVKQYEDEIEAVYAAAEASAQTGIAPPSEWTPNSILGYVRETVRYIMDAQILDDEDIFVSGGDSLKATYIRNSLLNGLTKLHKEPPEGLSQDLVYSNPTIKRLATHLMGLAGHNPRAREGGDGGKSDKLKEIENIISNYSIDFQKHRPSALQKRSSGEVVLLTGTTGALGSQLLSHLVSLSEISHVYALNRPGRISLRERQVKSLAERGLNASIVDSSKITLIEGEASKEGFDLTFSLFAEIRDSITLIIHNAWRVNFNLELGSFKPMILSLRNLVDFALRSPNQTPPRLIFISSVGVFRNHRSRGKPLEIPIKDPEVAIGSGYSESKFIGERILEEAAKSTPLRPIIVRVGQVSSNSSGAWNPENWVPALVRSGQILGALPARDDYVAWIPSDIVAQAIVELRTSNSQYFHLAHPHPTSWNTLFTAFSSSLKVPLVSWTEWLSRLERDGTNPERNPAIHLLEFFRACSPVALKDMEAPGSPMLDLTEALKSSPTLASPTIPRLDCDDVERWVSYWNGKGFLSV